MPSTRCDVAVYVTDCSESQQWLWEVKNYNWEHVINATEKRWLQIVWPLQTLSIITPNVLKLLAGMFRDYCCQLSQLLANWTTKLDCYVRTGNHLHQLCPIWLNKSMNADQLLTSEYGYVPRRLHMSVLGIQWSWFLFVAGILRIHGATRGWSVLALSGDQQIAHGLKPGRFNWCVVSAHGDGRYLVVRQSQLGVISMWFA